MSVDPVPPSTSEPDSPKVPDEPGAVLAEAARSKRRFRKGAAEEDAGGEKNDQAIELLSTLLQDLIAKKEHSPAPVETESKSTKYHRLSKTGSGSSAPITDAPAMPAPPVNAPTEPMPPVTPSPATGPASLGFRPAPTHDAHDLLRLVRRWRFLCATGIVVSAVTTYFLTTRLLPSTPDKLAEPAAGPAWTDAMIEQLDQALAADQAGDLKGAQRIAAAIIKPNGSIPPGLGLYLAGLGTRLDRNFDTEAALLRQITGSTPEVAAGLNEGLAFNFSRVREFDKASDTLRTASQNNPLSPALYYHWGETNRHLGHFLDAIACFRRALDRVPTGRPENASLRECIEFKLRLCLVEQARESEFQADLTERLQPAVPSGYWLLTAAAVALQQKDLPAAVASLSKARDVLGGEQFDALLNDYFFRAYADRKELADFFPPDPAARRAKLLPTMAYTVEP